MYTMSGAKKFLKSYGFDAMDVMLRKIGEDGDLTDEATALTYDESRYEQIEDELAETEDAIQEQDKRLIEFAELHKFWTESSLAKLNTKYVYWFREDGRQGIALRTAMDEMRKSGVLFKFIDVDEDDRRNMTGMYDQNVNVLKHVLKMNRDERDSLLKEKATLKVENLAEKRRITDVEAKTKSMLAGVDLLVIPRITVINAPTGFAIPNRIHRLDDAHLKAMKSFLRDGKPVLFLLGPPSHPRESPDMATTDPLETMLSEIGVNLPKQTILYNIESRDFNARKFGGALGGGTKDTEVPGLKFDESTMTVAQFTKVKQTLSPHAIRSSLTLMSRTGATKDAEEVRIRHPRPVYLMKTTMEPNAAASLVGGLVSPGMAGPIFASTIWVNKASQKPDENAVFLVTREESWNENNPFITKNKAPSFTPPKDDDPKKGTVEEPRTGPFPIGIAFETAAPAAWYDADSTKPKPARIAVIGSGGAFVGTDLTPLKEKVLFDVTNWLLGRDDLLARDVETWEYPRVPMKRGSLEFHLWHWGARLGLPLAFVYLGMVVWLVRRMR
jgi:hypothetical protein